MMQKIKIMLIYHDDGHTCLAADEAFVYLCARLILLSTRHMLSWLSLPCFLPLQAAKRRRKKISLLLEVNALHIQALNVQ
jgi:hypothetical protein